MIYLVKTDIRRLVVAAGYQARQCISPVFREACTWCRPELIIPPPPPGPLIWGTSAPSRMDGSWALRAPCQDISRAISVICSSGLLKYSALFYFIIDLRLTVVCAQFSYLNRNKYIQTHTHTHALLGPTPHPVDGLAAQPQQPRTALCPGWT